MSDEDPLRKGRPPIDDEEWLFIWDGAHKGRKMWPILKPFIALLENRVALAIVASVLIWLYSDRLIELIQRIAGR